MIGITSTASSILARESLRWRSAFGAQLKQSKIRLWTSVEIYCSAWNKKSAKLRSFAAHNKRKSNSESYSRYRGLVRELVVGSR